VESQLRSGDQMSGYSIYNILSGFCIGALVMTWIGFWIHQRQEKRHRNEMNRMQQQIITEVKNSLRK
jgi:Na+/H+ antiporter NhaC